MSYVHIDDEPASRAGVPRAALIVAGFMAVLTISLAAVARVSHTGTLGERSNARALAVRALVFSDLPGGRIGVTDVRQHVELAPLENGEASFVKGALRALARQRRLASISSTVPFYLIKWSDGRLTLDDSSTANHLELEAFGSTNMQAFEGLLTRH